MASFDCPKCGMFYMSVDVLKEIPDPRRHGTVRVIAACCVGLLISYAGIAFATDQVESTILGYAAGVITVLLFGGDK